MADTFKHYIMGAKEYKYTLKIAIDDIDNRMLDKIEYCLEKYELQSASAFKKTPIQESPLDFPNVRNHAVHISELVMAYPASRDFLETLISNKLGISEQQIVVYSENDPRRAETNLHLERSSSEYKENYKAVLGEDDYPVVETGMTLDDQKDNLIARINEVEDEKCGKSFYDWDMSSTGNDQLNKSPEDRPDDGTIDSSYSTESVTSVPEESFSLFGRMKNTEIIKND